jgi:hypothetical protein
MIPLFGFLETDTLGILIFAYPYETIAVLCQKLMNSAKLRTPGFTNPQCIHNGQVLSPQSLIKDLNFKPLDRFDVRRESYD